MILYKNRLILGIIRKFFNIVFTAINAILSVFNLQLTALIALIGVVLYFTGALEGNAAFKLIYEIILILSIVYAIIATVKKMLGLGKKKVKRSKGAQLVSGKDDNSQQETNAPAVKNEVPEPIKEDNANEKPIYYRVKQNRDYVMAEYSDRYELYRIESGTLKKIRTDYK